MIVKHRGSKKAKRALIQSIAINLSFLGFFKYADFIIGIVNGLFGLKLAYLNLSLPIGISFFTFQTMSYTIDVYRQDAPVQKSIISLGTYVTMFPQLIAGPIVRYNTLATQLIHRDHTYNKFSRGIYRFLIGLMKKILIANVIGEAIGIIASGPQDAVVNHWLTAVGFALQIYFDFSGYSDMAIGLGLFFGFEFMENFNYPYIAKSISDFWRRWHISLGQWFRDYVYIPLGGNKVSNLKWIRNIILVWLLTGLWHGAHWNYVLWGGLFAILLVLEKAFILKWLKKVPHFFQHLYVILLILLSFIVFRYEDFPAMIEEFRALLGFKDIPLYSPSTLYYLSTYGRLYLIAIVAATPVGKKLYHRLSKSTFKPLLEGGAYMGLLIALFIMTGYLVDASFNPFLYFRF